MSHSSQPDKRHVSDPGDGTSASPPAGAPPASDPISVPLSVVGGPSVVQPSPLQSDGSTSSLTSSSSAPSEGSKSPPRLSSRRGSFAGSFPSSLSGFFWEILGFPNQQTGEADVTSPTSAAGSENFLGAFDDEPRALGHEMGGKEKGIDGSAAALYTTSSPTEEEVDLLSPFEDAARPKIRLTGRNEQTVVVLTENLAEQ
ncbi:hypothetical protein HK104_001726, partial [Borealophlyctis nickersoniae]